KAAQEQKDRVELLKWLCNIDHTELYNSARNKYKDGTGEWLIDGSETFKAWEASTALKSFLWLHGKAGSGKSILSSSVIKHLQSRNKGIATTVLAYFYFSFSDIQKQRVDGMLESLIKQITAHRPYTPHSVQRLGEYKNNGGRPDTETLLEALIASMQGFSAYVRCQFENLQKLSSTDAVRKALRDLPSGLDSTYDRMLLSIDADFQPQVIASLKWLAFSVEPLEVDQLAEIFVLPSTIESGFDRMSYLFSPMDVLKYFPGLMVTQISHNHWDRKLYVRLAHFSIKEYLISDRISQGKLIDSEPRIADCLRFIFDNGAGVNMKENCSLAAALSVAARHEMEEVSRLLLDRGANVNEPAGQDGHPLQTLITNVSRPSLRFLEYMLNRGADPNAQGGTYNTALQAACATMYSDNIDAMTQVMELLIDRGADVSIQGGKYGTAFQAACCNDDVPTTVIDLLLEKGVDVNAQGGRYGNALQAACQRHIRNDASYGEKKRRQECMLEIVQLLLNRDADVHAQGGYYGTALQAACAKQNEDIVRLLINHGADVHAQGGYYGTALQAACVEQNVDIVSLLIDRGADVTVQGGRYGTALQTACVTGSLELVRLLLEKGARVNDEAGYHGTALQAACANSHIKVVRLLLEHGADVHLRNNGAWHVAARSRDDDLVRLLLDHGVDVNDAHGSHGSALQAAAAYSGQTPTINMLLNRGAHVNARGGKYGSALNAAVIAGFWDIVQVLLDAGA
ncbi:uncharacterized protein TRIVIDRAFT_123575, partial [Trichoderma virens Gv29-8]